MPALDRRGSRAWPTPTGSWSIPATSSSMSSAPKSGNSTTRKDVAGSRSRGRDGSLNRGLRRNEGNRPCGRPDEGRPREGTGAALSSSDSPRAARRSAWNSAAWSRLPKGAPAWPKPGAMTRRPGCGAARRGRRSDRARRARPRPHFRAIRGGLARFRDENRRSLALVIGGPDGHDPALRAAADLVVSLGAMTWPHQLCRIMLAEQLYRATTILAGHPYHRG